MCGIAGFFDSENKHSSSELKVKISKMTDVLSHRGPDDVGVWISEDNCVALGHRRLSILDLNKRGKQPFFSSSGRYIIIFNGEIYNFRKIKNELDIERNIKWKTNTDTEVIVEAFENWGIENSIKKFQGMFAIAIWDKKNNELSLVRDRFGIKPLYFGVKNNTLLFGSELKSLRQFGYSFDMCFKSINDFLHLGYIPAPNTIYKNLFKLAPGTFIKFKKNLESNHETYWDVNEIASECIQNKYELSYSNIVDKTENLLKETVNEHIISDAPIGSFLSGGIDSTLISLMMNEVSTKKINTFSMGFEDTYFNESTYAKKIANHLETNHTEFIFKTSEMTDLIYKLPLTYDEPFADSSQLPTSLLCSLTSNNVKVSLSGDGGDELFGGYNRYIYTERLWKYIDSSGSKKLKLIKWILSKISEDNINILYNSFGVKNFLNIDIHNPGQSLKKLSQYLSSNSREELYRNTLTTISDINNLINYENANNFDNDFLDMKNNLNFLEFMMLHDTKNYLSEDILTKVDRASMQNSLEVRVPFVSEEIFKHAWRIPSNLKIKNGKGKIILSDILKKYIPENLFERPKTGFALPIDRLLREELSGFVSDMLNEQEINNLGIFNYPEIKNLINKHKAGNNYGHRIWNLLMFQIWYKYWH